MKKLMIAFVAIAMAVATNASTFNWGITAGNLDTSKFANGSKIYLFHGTSAPDLTALGLTVAAFTLDNIMGETGDDLAVLNITGGATVATELTLNSGKAVLGNTPNVTSFGDSKTGICKVYSVAISADGQYAAVSTLKSPNIAVAASPSQATWSSTAFSVYQAAPEPTSGLLLLLGVAGLALKRKQK